MAEDVHITPEGLEAVRKEHEELTRVWRPQIAAKNEQGMKEARINELEVIIKNHVLIDEHRVPGQVAMGSTVRFREEAEDEETYRIVGPTEADPKSGRVSYESALGKAMLGHKVGDEVEVSTPSGTYRVRIVGID